MLRVGTNASPGGSCLLSEANNQERHREVTCLGAIGLSGGGAQAPPLGRFLTSLYAAKADGKELTGYAVHAGLMPCKSFEPVSDTSQKRSLARRPTCERF